MKRIYDNCWGIDMHKKRTVACFIHGKEQDIKEFGATTKELLLDDREDVLSPFQCKMMTELLKHVDELIIHIKNLDDEIDNRKNPEKKKAASAISELLGLADNSAKAVISVIGTDMSRFSADAHISS